MQLRQALKSAIERLTAQHAPSPRMNAELLIMFTLDCDRAYLYAYPERELTADEIAHKLNRSILSVRPRVSELRRQGEIRQSGARGKNESGLTASVWVISPPLLAEPPK